MALVRNRYPKVARRRTIFPLYCVAVVALATASLAQSTPTTAIIDGDASPLYKGLHGYLYGPITGAGSPTENLVHAGDGQSIGNNIQTICFNGNCKIVVLAIGFSNWTDEICHLQTNYPYNNNCDTFTFIYKATQLQVTNKVNPNVALVNCAVGGAQAYDWTNEGLGPNYNTILYTHCDQYLATLGLDPSQVQIVIYKSANSGQTGDTRIGLPLPVNFTLGNCASNQTSQPDACVLMNYVGTTARFLLTRYPNLKQMFLHSRIYGGYANLINWPLNPEPFAYEHGFAMKWIIQSQISETNLGTGFFWPVGSLNYKGPATVVAPWVDWGAYLWANGTSNLCVHCPINDAISANLPWVQSYPTNPPPPTCPAGSECDFMQEDYTHPSACGRDKVSSQLIYAYCNSPYTRWFRANPNISCATTIPAVSPINCPPPN